MTMKTPSYGSDMSTRQKQPSTRHNARTASDNRRYVRGVGLAWWLFKVLLEWLFCMVLRRGGSRSPGRHAGFHYDNPNELEPIISRPSSAQAGLDMAGYLLPGSRHAAVVGTTFRWVWPAGHVGAVVVARATASSARSITC